ncbi:MAG TPA: hypothetical protein VM736_07920 [Gemmatimonadales bacterium]|nr:hypothetical protein [Gemmatimonadales bacterium]
MGLDLLLIELHAVVHSDLRPAFVTLQLQLLDLKLVEDDNRLGESGKVPAFQNGC